MGIVKVACPVANLFKVKCAEFDNGTVSAGLQLFHIISETIIDANKYM